MEFARFLILSLVLLCSSSFAQSLISNIKDEWVLTRVYSKSSWKKILADFPELELTSTFGPSEKYALVRAKAKIGKTLSREIVGLQRNYVYRASEAQDPELRKSWGLNNEGQSIPEFGVGLSGVDVGAIKTWEIEPGNKKIVIAILDTGIDLKHEDLKNNLWMNKLELDFNSSDDDNNGWVNDINGWNFVEQNSNIQDDNNHGTAIAGVIASDSNNAKGSRGLLQNISLMGVKILDSNGAGTTERAVRGIEYAVKNGAHVINASWGGGLYDQVLFDTIQWANDRGVLVVCAAGNESKDNDTDDRPTYPASFKIPNIVSVAAHDPKGELASFSNFGKETVHLAAPGVGVFSTVRGGYQFLNGTSFAAPFVSAVGALLKLREPELSPSSIRDRMMATSVPMHYYLQKKLGSGGRLNVFNALKKIVTLKPETPIQWKRVVRSMETSHPYSNNFKQSFEFSQPGATHVRAHFTKFALEKQYDFVNIRDKEGLVAMTYSGKQDSFWSSDVLGDTLKIEFVSDFSNSEWGFSVDAFEYSSIP